MAELEWTLAKEPTVPSAAASLVGRLSRRFLDWEDWLTLLLTLAAALSVAGALEGGGWSDEMPSITLVSFLAVVASMLIAQTRLSAWLAWPLAVLLGALATFWQTLEMVGPGNLQQRVDAIYLRFGDWYDLATSGGVSSDPLPRDVLTIAVTWLGVFLFAWSVYRWHNAWIGLIPGGVALFVDLVFVGDELSGVVLLYLLFGLLLVMRTNLMARIARWRAEGTEYPALISLTFLNFSAWALLGLLLATWIAPVGPFSTPPLVDALSRGIERIGVNFVRLSGPLEVKKVVPVHNYTGVLPFHGSIKLGDREVLSVEVSDGSVVGPIPLRGAVYDVYTSGGWKAGERRDFRLPSARERLAAALEDGSVSGKIVPLNVKIERKSVVGTVLFSPGEPLSASVPFAIEVPAAAVSELILPGGAVEMSDEKVLTEMVPSIFGDDVVGLKVNRDADGRAASVVVFDTGGGRLPDALVAKPSQRLPEGKSYAISGFIPTVTPEELRAASWSYPPWAEQYLQLPGTVPTRVRALAIDIGRGRSEYDRAKAIESYLRAYPLDYRVSEMPPGADGVDYFLFESRRGYFDYHASAMVVMLRTLGIPARLAVGYVIDQSDFDPERGAYSVRDRNSYAWPEVYFAGHGWIAFNPSPDRPAELTPTIVEDVTPEDTALPVDGPPELPLNEDTTRDVLPEPGDNSAQFTSGSGDKYNPLLTAAVFAFAVMLAGAAALGWQRSVAGLPYPQQLWEKTVRLATWAGHAPEPGQTPAEFGRRLERAFHGASEFAVLASIYNRSRFGRRDVDGDERERLREMWPDLRGELLAAIPRRFLKRRR